MIYYVNGYEDLKGRKFLCSGGLKPKSIEVNIFNEYIKVDEVSLYPNIIFNSLEFEGTGKKYIIFKVEIEDYSLEDYLKCVEGSYYSNILYNKNIKVLGIEGNPVEKGYNFAKKYNWFNLYGKSIELLNKVYTEEGSTEREALNKYLYRTFTVGKGTKEYKKYNLDIYLNRNTLSNFKYVLSITNKLGIGLTLGKNSVDVTTSKDIDTYLDKESYLELLKRINILNNVDAVINSKYFYEELIYEDFIRKHVYVPTKYNTSKDSLLSEKLLKLNKVSDLDRYYGEIIYNSILRPINDKVYIHIEPYIEKVLDGKVSKEDMYYLDDYELLGILGYDINNISSILKLGDLYEPQEIVHESSYCCEECDGYYDESYGSYTQLEDIREQAIELLLSNRINKYFGLEVLNYWEDLLPYLNKSSNALKELQNNNLSLYEEVLKKI